MTPSVILLALCSFIFVLLGIVFLGYIVRTTLKKEASAPMKISRKPATEKGKSIPLPETTSPYAYARAK